MRAVWTVFFDTKHWTLKVAHSLSKSTYLKLCARIYGEGGKHQLDLGVPAMQGAFSKFGKGIVKRFEEVLSEDDYSSELGGFPIEYMKMMAPFTNLPELTCLFVDAGLHLVVVQKTWSILRAEPSGPPCGWRFVIWFLHA